MRKSGGKVKFDFPPPPHTLPLEWPEAPSWDVAKASGQVALLPRSEARIADLQAPAPHSSKANTEQDMGDLAFGSLFHDTPIPDLTGTTPEELRDYSVLLNDALIELSRLRIYDNVVYQWTLAVTRGATSEEQLRKLAAAARLSDAPAPDGSAAH
jgi:hypothetical protein